MLSTGIDIVKNSRFDNISDRLRDHLFTDYEIEITTTGYGWITEHKSGGAGESAFSSHNHDIKQEKRKLKVHGALKSGDKVVLIRQHGGQYYFVADRLPKEG